LQFTFANAGLAAPRLVVVVAAAIIAVVVITITKSLVLVCFVLRIMHRIIIIALSISINFEIFL
jgi:hypothetical protein